MSSALKWMPLVAALALAGCARDGYYDDREVDYADAKTSAPLVLPDSRNQRRYGNSMPVPESVGSFSSQGSDFRVPPPRALGVGSTMKAGSVARRQAGSDSWLVVGAEPYIVWSQLERFAQQRGLEIQRQEPNQGLLVTSEGDLRVRPGLQDGVSEVRCERNGMTEDGCLQALERHFQAGVAAPSSSSLVVQRPAEQQMRPVLEKQGGKSLLMLPFSSQRIYAELSHQLETDFSLAGHRELLSRDEGKQAFVVRYLPLSERGSGLLKSLSPFDAELRDIRLALTSEGQGHSVLKAEPLDDKPLDEKDRRELLQRVADLLR